jgi:hypothetical protein
MKPSVATIIALTIILICSTLSVAQNANVKSAAAPTQAKPNNHIKTKYNQSKDETTVTLKTLDLSGSMNKEMTRESELGNLDLDVSFIHKGKQPAANVDSATFKFKGLAKNPMFMRAQNFALVIDDATGLVLGTTSYSSNSQTFYLEEIMSISVPYQVMQRIAAAKTLAFQLGTRTVRLNSEQLADLKAMAAMMASGSSLSN